MCCKRSRTPGFWFSLWPYYQMLMTLLLQVLSIFKSIGSPFAIGEDIPSLCLESSVCVWWQSDLTPSTKRQNWSCVPGLSQGVWHRLQGTVWSYVLEYLLSERPYAMKEMFFQTPLSGLVCCPKWNLAFLRMCMIPNILWFVLGILEIF